MALPILDGNQSATTLSSILTSGEHIPAHTVVSLGTQAITNIATAVSGSVVSISNFPATQPVSIASVTVGNTVTIAGTVTANPTGTQTIAGTVTLGAGTAQIGSVTAFPQASGSSIVGAFPIGFKSDINQVIGVTDILGFRLPVVIGAGTAQIGSVTASISNSVTIGSLPAISGTVTANLDSSSFLGAIAANNSNGEQINVQVGNVSGAINGSNPLSISGTVTVGNSVTIGSLPAVTANLGDGVSSSTLNAVDQTKAVAVQIFDEDGNIKGGSDALLVKVSEIQTSIESRITNSDGNPIDNSNPLPISGTVTVGNSVTIGSLPAISGTVTANTFALQGTAVTTSDFTSTTASTLLASFNAGREVLTIFNEGASNLFVCAGATCTTIAYQVRLSAGDYYEVPNHQTTITHSAVFATAGTARVTQVS